MTQSKKDASGHNGSSSPFDTDIPWCGLGVPSWHTYSTPATGVEGIATGHIAEQFGETFDYWVPSAVHGKATKPGLHYDFRKWA